MKRALLPTLPVVLKAMNDAERAARTWPERRRRRGMGSITWGTRSLGMVLPDGTTTDRNVLYDMPRSVPLAIPGLFPNPDTLPGAWPGLNPPVGITATPIVASGGPAQIPQTQPAVVVTPTSGPIPSPATVAAAQTPVSWLDQEMITGVSNKWLVLTGIGAWLFFGGKRK